jgi:hypothetical protein
MVKENTTHVKLTLQEYDFEVFRTMHGLNPFLLDESLLLQLFDIFDEVKSGMEFKLPEPEDL